MKRPLTTEELKALEAFAEYAGHDWKLQLMYAWRRGAFPGIIHGLRNTHGPSWLAEFKLERG